MPDETPISRIAGLDHYQAIAFETAIFPKEIGPLYCAMGALGESGELISVLYDYYTANIDEDMEITREFEGLLTAVERAITACKEVERLKKLARKGQITLPKLPALPDDVKSRVKSEQGDCMWYQAGTAQVLGYKLSSVCQQNIKKLRERRDAGVIASAGETITERLASESVDRLPD